MTDHLVATHSFVLPDGVFPVSYSPGDLDEPFWEGTKKEELRIQFCTACDRYQWGPGVICHHCHSFDLGFRAVSPKGAIFSWQRTWHPTVAGLADAVPYVALVVELVDAPGIYLLGNLVGDQKAEVEIGSVVEGVFEHHAEYTLVQWRPVE